MAVSRRQRRADSDCGDAVSHTGYFAHQGMTETQTVALLGLPQTGKSTYLGALWQIIQDLSQTSIFEEDVTGDRSYVDELGIRVSKAVEISRTEVDSRGRLAIKLRFEGEGIVTVNVPDLSGESARQLIEDRVWRKTLVDAIESADSLILFVHPERIDAPVSITFANAIAIGRISPLTGSTSSSRSGRPVGRSVSSIACSSVSIASRWLAVVETCQPSSSFE